MQTIEFLKTARWIVSLYRDLNGGGVLDNRIIRLLSECLIQAVKLDEKTINDVLLSLFSIAQAGVRIRYNKKAEEIINAFGLDRYLLNERFLVDLSKFFSDINNKDRSEIHEIVGTLMSFNYLWVSLENCITPIEKITIPQEVLHEIDFDEILTLELQYENETLTKVETIVEVITDVQKLYGVTTRLTNNADENSLKILYITSGSAVRIDFKGIGEVVKQLKELIITAFRMFLHRRSEQIQEDTKQALERVKFLKDLAALAEKKVLDPKEYVRLKKTTLDSISPFAVQKVQKRNFQEAAL